MQLPHHSDTTPTAVRTSRRRARSENSVCSICNNLHYTNHLSALIDHIRPSAHTSPRLVVERSGIEDIIPWPPNTRRFAATYPSPALRITRYSREIKSKTTGHIGLTSDAWRMFWYTRPSTLPHLQLTGRTTSSPPRPGALSNSLVQTATHL